MRADLRDPAYLGALVFFERVAARLSFAQAAADLGVTPSAISHRIALLEAVLGHRLFERSPRHVSLTREGSDLASATREALGLLRQATESLAGRRVLRLSIGPYLSAHWLMPRLAGFERQMAGARIDLLHRTGWPSLKDVDLAIVWHDTPPVDAQAELLFEPDYTAVAAPGVLGEGPLWAQGLPPLHYRDRSLWRQWLQETGGPRDFADTGEVFDDPNLVLEAAAHGRGIAMGFLPFAADLFASGRLVRAYPLNLPSPTRYWMVPGGGESGLVAPFLDWLRSEAAKTKQAEQAR